MRLFVLTTNATLVAGIATMLSGWETALVDGVADLPEDNVTDAVVLIDLGTTDRGLLAAAAVRDRGAVLPVLVVGDVTGEVAGEGRVLVRPIGMHDLEDALDRFRSQPVLDVTDGELPPATGGWSRRRPRFRKSRADHADSSMSPSRVHNPAETPTNTMDSTPDDDDSTPAEVCSPGGRLHRVDQLGSSRVNESPRTPEEAVGREEEGEPELESIQPIEESLFDSANGRRQRARVGGWVGDSVDGTGAAALHPVERDDTELRLGARRGGAKLRRRMSQAAADLQRVLVLLDQAPALRAPSAIAEALAAELVAAFGASVCAVLMSADSDRLGVVAGAALTRAEYGMRVPADHPLLEDLREVGPTLLIDPLQLAAPMVAGIPGARTAAMMATLSIIDAGASVDTLVVVGGDAFKDRDLRRMEAIIEDASPGLQLGYVLQQLANVVTDQMAGGVPERRRRTDRRL